MTKLSMEKHEKIDEPVVKGSHVTPTTDRADNSLATNYTNYSYSAAELSDPTRMGLRDSSKTPKPASEVHRHPGHTKKE
jgi:hypothetical protein